MTFTSSFWMSSLRGNETSILGSPNPTVPTPTTRVFPPAGGNTRVVGVGTVGLGEPRIDVSFPLRLDIQKDEVKVIAINVSNPVRGSNVTNVSVEVSGYEERLVSVSPLSIRY